jgi:hypothetical protein
MGGVNHFCTPGKSSHSFHEVHHRKKSLAVQYSKEKTKYAEAITSETGSRDSWLKNL